MGVEQAAVAGDDLDLAALEQVLDAAALLRDDRGLARHEGAEVEAGLAEGDAELPGAARQAQPLDGRHQGLGRDAAAVETGAADLARLDQGDLRAELRGAQRGHVAGRAAAQHDDVFAHDGVSPVGR